MLVTAIKTDRLQPGSIDLFGLLDRFLPTVPDGSVVAITSKVVSMCENHVVPIGTADKQELVIRESDWYLPASSSKYGHHFTIKNNTIVASAGIDESNGGGNYVLWPRDVQATANQVRAHLKHQLGLPHLGIIITDSTSHPLRRGAVGTMLAFSGFAALKNYVGTHDLFDRPFRVELGDIAGGLAATAVLAMGEGNEQTPIAVLSDLPFVEFQDRDPTEREIAAAIIPVEDDLFAPFWLGAHWQKGGGHSSE